MKTYFGRINSRIFFSLVEMFQYNFFDENFNVIFKNINKFVLDLKDDGTLKSIKITKLKE